MAGPRPLRVAMVIQRFRPWFSGQGVQVEELARALARRGVESAILTAARAAAPATERHRGYRIERLRCDAKPLGSDPSKSRLFSPLFAARVCARLLRLPIDLVHVHAATDALYAAWLVARLRRIPIVFEMTLLGEDDPLAMAAKTNAFARLRKRIYARSDAYVAISPALASAYEAAGLPRERLWLIPQGVDVARFVPVADRARARGAIGVPADGPLLAFVGSLIERKGVDVLLTAWDEVQRRRPDARLLLVGRRDFSDDPPAREFLDRQLERIRPDARRRIHFAGEVEDTERWLAAADAFVFPSRREGFGTVIVEAMAAGLPCVVAELPGITDFIFAGAEAVVVSGGDAPGLAAATLALLDDPPRAAALGRAARARAVAAFAFDRIAAAYLELYSELVARRQRPSLTA